MDYGLSRRAVNILCIVGIGLLIILCYAYIQEVKGRASAEAEVRVSQAYEVKLQAAAQSRIDNLEAGRKTEVDQIEKESKSIKTPVQAQKVITENIPAAPIITRTSVDTKIVDDTGLYKNVSLKEGLLCYDDKGQVNLAQYAETCREHQTNETAYKSQLAEKDKIISSKQVEIDNLGKEKRPGFWPKVWMVTKFVAPTAATAYTIGRIQGGKR